MYWADHLEVFPLPQKITVITADIVSSRDLGFDQDLLKQKIEAVNSALPELLVPFRVSRGDEIQGIMKGWLSSPAILRRLRYYLRPIALRIGIGLGFSDAIVNSSWDMNGIPFYRAREALDQNKASGAFMTLLKSGQAGIDQVANALLILLDSIRGAWSDEQWEAVHKYEQLGTYALAGEAIQISAQAVHKRCRHARWDEFRVGESALAEIGGLLEALSTKES